jgi:LuxR family transcriptional regulator of csgAB operon
MIDQNVMPDDDRPPSRRRPHGELTRREADVLRLVAAGKPSRTVASDLGVAEATVKSHLNSVYRKLGVRNRVQATNWYLNSRPAQEAQADARPRAGRR